MNLKEFTFKIVGLSPLLCNNPMSVVRRLSGGINAKIPPPEQEAENSLYKNDDGTYYLPALQLRQSTLYACAGKKAGKRTAKSVIASSVFISEPKERTTLINPTTGKPLTKKDWEIDSRPAVIQKSRIIRSRPKFKVWGGLFVLTVDVDLLGDVKGTLLPLMTEAGIISGLGDYRPQKSGWFGKYEPHLVE